MEKKNQHEYRVVKFQTETRKAENGVSEDIIRGYPILFNSPAKVWAWVRGDWREVTETILPSALDDIDLKNIFFLVGHNPDNVLGRSGINVRLEVDETGLFMECKIPHTQYARDWYELVRSGIVDGMSFGFECYDPINPETLTRTITHFSTLYEVSLTPFPAYKETLAIAGAGGGSESAEKNTEALAREIEKMIKEMED